MRCFWCLVKGVRRDASCVVEGVSVCDDHAEQEARLVRAALDEAQEREGRRSQSDAS